VTRENSKDNDVKTYESKSLRAMQREKYSDDIQYLSREEAIRRFTLIEEGINSVLLEA